ncbi:MAG: type II toxin-antitoxin system VapC family toxin [Methylococcaceae bacterium]|nr:type II toxin-antitoxin system VapC family toxin [Methylococcaceae bacterium]
MDSPRYLLDTNILSELIKQPAGVVALRIVALDEDSLHTSIVVACEMRYGAAKKGSSVLTAKIEALLANIQILPLEAAVDRHYADIRCHLEKNGTPIGAHDMLIAAHARALDFILVSANLREFLQVPGLRVENWLDVKAL